MKTFIVKQLLQALGVCVVISMISFFLLFLNTDPALLLLPPEAEVQDIAKFKQQMGLDRPVLVQYLDFVRKVVVHGDFGASFVAKVPAAQLVQEACEVLAPYGERANTLQGIAQFMLVRQN